MESGNAILSKVSPFKKSWDKMHTKQFLWYILQSLTIIDSRWNHFYFPLFFQCMVKYENAFFLHFYIQIQYNFDTEKFLDYLNTLFCTFYLKLCCLFIKNHTNRSNTESCFKDFHSFITYMWPCMYRNSSNCCTLYSSIKKNYVFEVLVLLGLNICLIGVTWTQM